MSATIIETINPATGKVIAKYHNMDDDQIREKVKNARLALHSWKNLDIGERCSIVRNLGRVMRKNKDSICKTHYRRNGQTYPSSDRRSGKVRLAL